MTVTPALAGSGSSSQTDLRAELEGDEIDGEEPRGNARFVEQVDGDVTVSAPDGTVILAGTLEAH